MMSFPICVGTSICLDISVLLFFAVPFPFFSSGRLLPFRLPEDEGPGLERGGRGGMGRLGVEDESSSSSRSMSTEIPEFGS